MNLAKDFTYTSYKIAVCVGKDKTTKLPTVTT